MPKNKKTAEEYSDGSYVVKKSRKSNILAFVLCLFLAFFIWAYAESTENNENSMNNGENTEVSADSGSSAE